MASRIKLKAPEPRPLAKPLGGGFGRDLSNWLFPAFFLMIAAGFVVIWKWGSPAGNPNGARALFLSMNCATLSGFSTGSGVAQLNDVGQWTAFFLIVGGSLFAMIVGGLAVIRIARLPFSDGALICCAFIVEIAALLVGASLLWDMDRSPFQAMFLAGASFGNCGQAISNLPAPASILVHAIILPLSILGGLGLPVLMEIWCALVLRAKLSVHSRTVLATTAWLYVVGLILLLALNLGGIDSWPALRDRLAISSVFCIESRTGGLPIASIRDLSEPARWILVALMLIGASSGGAGSGLKTTTVAELALGAKKLLRGGSVGRPLGIAFVWLAIYLGLLLGAVLLLAHVSGNDPGRNVLFDAVSALSNVGFTSSPLADEQGVLFAYCAVILVGRMAPLLVLWWMAETTADAEMAIG